jgi:uncharacterized RDD family membrane protein YckC
MPDSTTEPDVSPPQPPPPPAHSYPPPAHVYPPPAPYGTPYWAAPPGPAPGLAYAGFWIRFVAYLIDGLIINVPLFIVFFVVAGSTISAHSITCNVVNTTVGQSVTCTGLGELLGVFTVLWAAALLLPWIYFSVMWSWQGQSIGQKILGLHVVDGNNGAKISVGRAILRYFGVIISTWALFIGLIWAAFDPRKQGWHDKIASTFVVRRV